MAIGVSGIMYPGRKLHQENDSLRVDVTMFATARHPPRSIGELMAKADRDLVEADEANRLDLFPSTGKYFGSAVFMARFTGHGLRPFELSAGVQFGLN